VQNRSVRGNGRVELGECDGARISASRLRARKRLLVGRDAGALQLPESRPEDYMALMSLRAELDPRDLSGRSPGDTAPLAGPPTGFDEIRGRGTLDYALRTIQQTQNQLSAMADTKASIMITVCSIVLTIGITRFEISATLRWPLLVLIGSVLTSLFFAVLAVLPSLAVPRKGDGSLDVEAPWFNLFFFGHFAQLPRETFEVMLANVARDDTRIYAMLARDIYGQGVVLARRKYRMLRWSYVIFFAGILVTAVAAITTIALESQ
jgi:hypothetical protein